MTYIVGFYKKIQLDHSIPIYFCLDFKWFLTKWRPFFRISNGWVSGFQIPFKIRTICNPTSFCNHSKSRLVWISDPHCTYNNDTNNSLFLFDCRKYLLWTLFEHFLMMIWKYWWKLLRKNQREWAQMQATFQARGNLKWRH